MAPFTIVPGAGGLEDAKHGINEGTICSFADYDNDGLHGRPYSAATARRRRFTITKQRHLYRSNRSSRDHARVNAMGIAWGDYDNDGLLDLYISRGKQNGLGDLGNTLYRNNGERNLHRAHQQGGSQMITRTLGRRSGAITTTTDFSICLSRGPGPMPSGSDNANILYHNNARRDLHRQRQLRKAWTCRKMTLYLVPQTRRLGRL